MQIENLTFKLHSYLKLSEQKKMGFKMQEYWKLTPLHFEKNK